MGCRGPGRGVAVHASGHLEADDRLGLERLLRNCAQPAIAPERLREIDAERLVHESVKPKARSRASLTLNQPPDQFEQVAAPIPPPGRRAAEPQEAAIRLSGPMALPGRLLSNEVVGHLAVPGHFLTYGCSTADAGYDWNRLLKQEVDAPTSHVRSEEIAGADAQALGDRPVGVERSSMPPPASPSASSSRCTHTATSNPKRSGKRRQ